MTTVKNEVRSKNGKEDESSVQKAPRKQLRGEIEEKFRGYVVLQVILVFLFVLDHSMYFGNASFTFGQMNIPASSVLRPVLPILMFRRFRITFLAFLSTLYKAANVFLFMVIFLLCSSVLGMELFGGGALDQLRVSFRGYGTMEGSLVNTFVYVTTVANYADVVYTSIACEKG